MKLVYQRGVAGFRKTGELIKSGDEVMIGDVVSDFRNEAHIVTDMERPRHENSTGRVYVKPVGGKWTTGCFPSVFNMEWIEGEDNGTANGTNQRSL